jgi:hypothetical protein
MSAARHIGRSIMLLVCTCALASAGRAADADTTSAALTVIADVDSSYICVADTLVGRSPFRLTALRPGRYAVVAHHPEIARWDAPSARAMVELAAGADDTLRLRLDQLLRIVTDPSGASVRLGDSLLGTTPLAFRDAGASPRAELIVTREGYHPLRISPEDPVPPLVVLVKDSLAFTGRDEMVAVFRPESPAPWHLYVTGGMVVVAGAVSAVAKIAADRAYAEYLLTGDTGQLSRTRSLDGVAAASLAATQINFALFTYFLFSD